MRLRAHPPIEERSKHAARQGVARHPDLPELPWRDRVPGAGAGHRVRRRVPVRLSGPRRRRGRDPRHADRRGREARHVTRTDLDDPSAIEAADPSGMLRTILDLARQCREGYEAGRAVQELPDASSVTAIAVCGMGGSGVAGDFLRALYHDRLTVPLEVVKDPELP